MTTDTALAPITEPTFDLHFDEVIDNPTIFVRGCFPAASMDKIREGIKAGYAYRLLIVAQLNGDYSNRQEIREIKDPKDFATFITFTKPGTWYLGAFLFQFQDFLPEHSADKLEAALRSTYLAKPKKDSYYSSRYENSIERLTLIDSVTSWTAKEAPEKQQFHKLPAEQGRIAKQVVTLELPEEIFAPEPSQWVKDYANYFTFGVRAADECAIRRRFLYMIPGVVPYLVVELVKRVFTFGGGIVGLLLGFKNTGKLFVCPFAPLISLPLDPLDDVFSSSELMAPFKKGRWYLVPGCLILYALALFFVYLETPVAWGYVVEAWAWIMSLPKPSFKFSPIYFYIVAAVFGPTLFVRMGWKYSPSFRKGVVKVGNRLGESTEAWLEKRTETKKIERQKRVETAKAYELAVLDRRATVLICGPGVEKLTPGQLPKEMRTIRFRYAEQLRKVCRPFA